MCCQLLLDEFMRRELCHFGYQRRKDSKNVEMRIVENYYKVKTCVIREIDVVLKGRKIVLICFLKKKKEILSGIWFHRIVLRKKWSIPKSLLNVIWMCFCLPGEEHYKKFDLKYISRGLEEICFHWMHQTADIECLFISRESTCGFSLSH